MTLLGDYVHVPRRHVPVPASGLVRLLGDFGFSEQSARVALSRLVKRALLTRERDGRRARYGLTDRARRVLDEGEHRIFGFPSTDPWDGTWTLLTYSIPEGRRAERERLRARLTFLGFGSAHDGHWIAPRDRQDDVIALAEDLGVREHVHVFVGCPSRHEDPRALLQAGWDLDGLDARYRAFVDDFRPLLATALVDRDALVVRTLVMHRFRRFPGLDPDVPGELLPGPGSRTEAIAVFQELWRGLAASARHHFAARTEA